MSKITILDGYTSNPGDLEWFSMLNVFSSSLYERTEPEDIVSRAFDSEILLTNKVLLGQDVLDQLPNCRCICLMSTGTNAVDLEACREKGITVCNVPAYSTASVVEWVIAAMLALARGVEAHAGHVQDGGWVRSADFSYHIQPQVELAGKTLGIYGFGAIGQGVASVARALGMRVAVYTRHPESKPMDEVNLVTPKGLFAAADVLSLHCPLVPETEHLINTETLAGMKPTAWLINSGRGGLVDEAALAHALNNRALGAAALDVLSSEPPSEENPLLCAPNCLINPHMAWATKESRARLLVQLEANIKAWLAGKPINVVT